MTHRDVGGRVVGVPAVSRVEGDGGLAVRVRGDRVTDVELRIFEPPRFFEAFLRGRRYTEPPDITARICGICPVAYQLTACQAIEAACGVEVNEPIRDLRRLLYCGEWIESHALHVYLLHAPDFLGYRSAIELAGDRPDLVERGLQLKKAGNEIIEVVGGRAIHPVNVRVGGFYRAPDPTAVAALGDRLRRARDAAEATVHWVAGFDVPDAEHDYRFVALRHPSDYAVLDGQVASSGGLDVAPAELEQHVVETQVPHSTALHAHLVDGSTYLVGALARYALSADRLRPVAREAARAAGLPHPCRNPFRSIVVRAVEILHACDLALELVERYEPPDPAAATVAPRPGTGAACTEAPRGLLYHRYAIDEDGLVSDARIIPPTAQNQTRIEADLAALVQGHLDLDDRELADRCERLVRSHDPCISCATHFLDLRVERT